MLASPLFSRTDKLTHKTSRHAAHFIKTVEDLGEVMAQAGGGAKWGVAFCEASGDPDNTDMPGERTRHREYVQ